MEKNIVLKDTDTNMYIFKCPHCNLWIEVPVNQVNCHIFRHAFFFQRLPNGQILLTNQLNPHATKAICDELAREKKIVGCGKPFKFIDRDGGYYVAEKCGYI